MKTDARFIGTDGSCGLRKGQIYRIEIVDNSDNLKRKYRYRVWVNGIGIPYDTMNGIRKNWKILTE